MIEQLWQPVQDKAVKLHKLCADAGIVIRSAIHGVLRIPQDQITIYGKEQFTLHYIGCAYDFAPVLKVKQADFEKAYNSWPYWDRVQCELAVEAGFDPPQEWQLDHDRPHVQCLFGCSYQVIKQLWYSSLAQNTDLEKAKAGCWHYISTHGAK